MVPFDDVIMDCCCVVFIIVSGSNTDFIDLILFLLVLSCSVQYFKQAGSAACRPPIVWRNCRWSDRGTSAIFKTIRPLKWMSCTNGTSRNFSLRWVSDVSHCNIRWILNSLVSNSISFLDTSLVLAALCGALLTVTGNLDPHGMCPFSDVTWASWRSVCYTSGSD